MKHLMRICIICLENKGREFIKDSVYGCVELVPFDKQIILSEGAKDRFIVKNGEAVRVVYNECRLCKEWDTCFDRMKVLKECDCTTGYCHEHGK